MKNHFNYNKINDLNFKIIIARSQKTNSNLGFPM